VANKPKRYDLKAADRRRSRLIQFGLTGIVILFAVGMVLLIVKPWAPKVTAQAITVSAQDKLIKNPDGKPKAVLTLYEDFLCPVCKGFEMEFGTTVDDLITSGAVQADYYMVAILDNKGEGYSSRSGNAAYCVAEADTTPTKEKFRRFHGMLYAAQPEEIGGSYPNNDDLLSKARVAGLETNSSLKDCINNGKYTKMVKGLAEAEGVNSTPTIRINGKPFSLTKTGPDGKPIIGPDQKPVPKTRQDLIAAVTEITGQVPGLTPAPAPEPAPTGPPPTAP
jgi:protein-disulfide isomerase